MDRGRDHVVGVSAGGPQHRAVLDVVADDLLGVDDDVGSIDDDFEEVSGSDASDSD